MAVFSEGIYVQLGLALTLPAALLLLPGDRPSLVRLARSSILALVSTLLLSGIFLVPFLHFLPQIEKGTNPSFEGAQAFAFVPLNLVIDDRGFYYSTALGKFPYPSHYANFLGWIPVLLALSACGLWAFRGSRTPHERRAIPFLAASALLILWGGSAGPQRLLLSVVTQSWWVQVIAGLRYPSFMVGLAATPILALAAIALDRGLAAPWPRLVCRGAKSWLARVAAAMDLRWLLAFPLALALAECLTFSRLWIQAEPLHPTVYRVLANLQTPDLQWVNVPLGPVGQHFFVEPALGRNLKLAHDFYHTWHWKDRLEPQPVRNAVLEIEAPGAAPGVVILPGIPGADYAAVRSVDGSRTPCAAHGIGGELQVSCDTPQAGILTVQENQWTGWQAWVDGQSTALQEGQWLAVDLPAGKHDIAFRYRPWDVWLGLGLSLVGVVLAGFLWRKPA
jgi:hypothetical protein